MKYNRKELQEFISNNLIGKQKTIPYNRQTFRWYEIRNLTDYYHDILETTNYLQVDCKFNERCYQIIHNLSKPPICKECNNLVNYVDFPNGYREYCKSACSTKGKKQIDKFIEKFGKKVGTEKYNEMIKNKTQSKERFIELYGDEDGKKRWKSRNKKCKLNSSLEGFINRYGKDKGKTKYLEYINKLKFRVSLEGFINNYGKEEGTVKYNEMIRKKSQTLDRFIEIYGDEDGLRKYNEYNIKRSNPLNNTNISQESLDFFQPIIDYILVLDDLNLVNNTYIGSKNKQEYFLLDNELNKIYYYDLTIEPLKIIFEYNGIAFHPNKDMLTAYEWSNWKTPYSNISADEKYKYDRRKIELAEKNGFTIIEIWSDENLEKAQENCIMLIDKKNKGLC